MSDPSDICAAFPAYFDAQHWPGVELFRVNYEQDKRAYAFFVFSAKINELPPSPQLCYTLYRRDSGQHLTFDRVSVQTYVPKEQCPFGFVLDIFEEFLETRKE